MSIRFKIISLKGAIVIHILCLTISCDSNTFIGNYEGTPYSDSLYSKGSQTIPGIVHLEYYDFGGEGISFHDSDSLNSGSGNLNPPNGSYLNEFRINEPVDISYTKSAGIDDTEFNFAPIHMNQLYLGWTLPDEWTRYSVHVLNSGYYKIGLMYTSNSGGSISIAVNDNPPSDTLFISSTFVEADTVSWRQWHHWNYDNDIGKILLKKGFHVLTVKTIEKGNMNYDYLSFTLIDN